MRMLSHARSDGSRVAPLAVQPQRDRWQRPRARGPRLRREAERDVRRALVCERLQRGAAAIRRGGGGRRKGPGMIMPGLVLPTNYLFGGRVPAFSRAALVRQFYYTAKRAQQTEREMCVSAIARLAGAFLLEQEIEEVVSYLLQRSRRTPYCAAIDLHQNAGSPSRRGPRRRHALADCSALWMVRKVCWLATSVQSRQLAAHGV